MKCGEELKCTIVIYKNRGHQEYRRYENVNPFSIRTNWYKTWRDTYELVLEFDRYEAGGKYQTSIDLPDGYQFSVYRQNEEVSE